MLKMHEIRELIKLVDQSSVTDFEYEYEGQRIILKKNTVVSALPPQPTYVVQEERSSEAAPVPEVQAVQSEQKAQEAKDNDTAGLHKITSPMVGTFYTSPAPDAAPYVQKGDKIRDNTIVCIVEAMKLMNEIEAEVRGEIVDILVENGQLVEYGQPLFLVKPE